MRSYAFAKIENSNVFIYLFIYLFIVVRSVNESVPVQHQVLSEYRFFKQMAMGISLI
jgi:hypothetical protein